MEVRDGEKLRRKRKNRQYTCRELAMLVRRSHTTISKIETGKLKNISEDLALLIAARLGVEWEEYFIDHAADAVPAVSNGGSTARQKMPA